MRTFVAFLPQVKCWPLHRYQKSVFVSHPFEPVKLGGVTARSHPFPLFSSLLSCGCGGVQAPTLVSENRDFFHCCECEQWSRRWTRVRWSAPAGRRRGGRRAAASPHSPPARTWSTARPGERPPRRQPKRFPSRTESPSTTASRWKTGALMDLFIYLRIFCPRSECG